MGASPEYFADLAVAIRDSSSHAVRDVLLEEWYDITMRATDWDALQWGFDPKRWCSELRKHMECRIAEHYAIQRGTK